LTVVTVCYNDLESLKNTCESIRNNLDNIFEWIVIDGNSNDGTKEFLESNDIISNYISENDDGIYDAMNKGTVIAQGEYIVYLNAGDTFNNKSQVRKVLGKIKNKPGIVFTGALFTSQNKTLRYRAPRKFKSVWHSVPANHQATLFSTEVLGSAPYNTNYKICGDYELAAQLYTQSISSQVIDEPLVSFEVGGISTFEITKLSQEAFKIQIEVLCLPKYISYFSWLRRQLALSLNLIITKISSKK
jgi:putative colanic acid biosynthesis glycosyltransferase